MREAVKTKELGRGYKVVLLQTHKSDGIGDFDLYDVEVQNNSNRTIVATSSGCIGEKSGEFWMKSAVQFMQRLLLLDEAREMAYHNQSCYSKNYINADEPKDGYEDKWEYEKEKASVIEKWMCDHSEYFGKKDDRTNLIRAEFDIHEIFV